MFSAFNDNLYAVLHEDPVFSAATTRGFAVASAEHGQSHIVVWDAESTHRTRSSAVWKQLAEAVMPVTTMAGGVASNRFSCNNISSCETAARRRHHYTAIEPRVVLFHSLAVASPACFAPSLQGVGVAGHTATYASGGMLDFLAQCMAVPGEGMLTADGLAFGSTSRYPEQSHSSFADATVDDRAEQANEFSPAKCTVGVVDIPTRVVAECLDDGLRTGGPTFVKLVTYLTAATPTADVTGASQQQQQQQQHSPPLWTTGPQDTRPIYLVTTDVMWLVGLLCYVARMRSDSRCARTVAPLLQRIRLVAPNVNLTPKLNADPSPGYRDVLDACVFEPAKLLTVLQTPKDHPALVWPASFPATITSQLLQFSVCLVLGAVTGTGSFTATLVPTDMLSMAQHVGVGNSSIYIFKRTLNNTGDSYHMEPLLQWSKDYEHRLFHEIDLRVDKFANSLGAAESPLNPVLVKQAAWFCLYACNGYLEHWLYTPLEMNRSATTRASPSPKFHSHDTTVKFADSTRAQRANSMIGYLLPTFTYSCFNEPKAGWVAARLQSPGNTRSIAVDAEWARACSGNRLFEGVKGAVQVKTISCATFDDR